MMYILMSETCWAHKKWNKIASDIKLVFHSSTVEYIHLHINWGNTVVQFVEALLYKPEGLGFDSRWCNWNFSFTIFSRPHSHPGVVSISNRYEYHVYLLGVKAAGACSWQSYHLHFAEYLEIWEPQPPGNLRKSPGLKSDGLSLTYKLL